MSEQQNHVRNLAVAALFAATITLFIVVFRVPWGLQGGMIHVGDAIIYLAAVLLPKPYALAAASIGGGMANVVTGTLIWAPATMIIKPLIAASFTSKGKMICTRNIVALFIGAAITVVGYYLYAVLVFGSWQAPLAGVVGDLFQSCVSAVMFLILASAFERMKVRNRLGLGTNQ
ncbi:MAG: TIGR04002 family protein [Oscillospiraceae bacterium]|nr:TIGR04002 family protein [Oscillospiraceae bacterium]